MAGIQAGIAIAPDVEAAVAAATQFIKSLTGTTIDVATQNAMFAHVYDVANAILVGEVPPAWQVQP